MCRKMLVGIMVLAVAGLVLAQSASAAITGSEHDFSTKSWNPGGQICIVCHTPHNSLSTLVPLWNHATSTATYTLYASPTLNATVGAPSAASKACLSCHDGTVALDSFGGSTGTNFMTGGDKLGTDLSNDHPVSFTYDAALATTDGGLYDPTTKTVTALGGKTVDAAMLIGHKVECASCHDVHRNKGDSVTAGNLLLVNNSGSKMCLVCHNK